MPLTQTCTASGKTFEITDDDLKFYAKMEVPPPTLCPEERNRRRLAYRNFHHLYQRKCDATGKSIITMYHADQPFEVYENEYWWSDAWDPIEYGQGLDFSRSFFDQYHKLAMKVPRYATMNLDCENCRYSNMAWKSKDSYLVFGCVRDEDCMYGHIVWDCISCFDNLYLFRCELCSNCVDCTDSYNLHFSTECSHCHDSYFLHDCRGCNHCFGCVNIRDKEFYFMGEPLGREAYFKKIKEITPISHDTIDMGKGWLEKTKKEKSIFPDKFELKNEDCSGNHIYESKNAHHVFDAKKLQDSKYIYTGYEQVDSYDVSFTGGLTECAYECLTMFSAQNCIGCHIVNQCHHIYYCEFCYNCEHCLGCNGLRHKKYCILNKQYSQTEYEGLKDKIIEHMKKNGEWGQFFPAQDSPFAYNESIVHEYYPMTQEEATTKGYQWKDTEPFSQYHGEKYQIPQTITQVPSNITDKILTCEASGKNYKIQRKEWQFYQNMGLPLPRAHPDLRHIQRMALRNPRQLWNRQCHECQKTIQTTFAPERPEKVLCEGCYLSIIN